MKKSGFKYQIEQELIRHNWKIIEVGSNEDWWDDEHWKIQLRFDSNISFYLCFIVDPQFDQTRKKGQGIYEIMASTKFPKNWNNTDNQINSIDMTKRKFNIKLAEFLEDLNNFKKGKTTTNKS